MDNVFQQMADKDSQKSQPTAPSAAPQPSQGGNVFEQMQQADQKQNPPASTVTAQSKATTDNSEAANELKRKQAAGGHGILARAWDWVNQPLFDNVLPEGVKTADIIKAAAFEKLYNEAYIPGVNDFNTKSASHFEPAEKMQAGLGPKEKDGVIKKNIRKFLIDHAQSIDASANAANTGVAGAARDAADMGAGFTSPLALGTMGLNKVGRVGKVLSPLVGTAFGLQGLGQTGEGAKDLLRTTTWENLKNGYLDPDAVQETLGGAGQASLGATASLHAAGDVVDFAKGKATPEIKNVAGQDVPVRAENATAQMVQKAVPDEINQAAARNTATAVQKGIGDVVGQAVGSDADTDIHQKDRLGIRAHADDLKTRATTAMDELNRMSDGMYNDARDMADKSRYDQTTEGRDKFKAGMGLMRDVEEQYRDEMTNKGHDIDEMRSNYRQAIALEKISKRLETATSARAGEADGFDVDGKKLVKAIDDLRKVSGDESDPSHSKNLFDRAGLTENHINALAELADTLREQQETPKFGTMAKLGAKALSIAAMGHGVGLGGALEALTGESIAEHIGSKAMGKLFGEALTDVDTARQLNAALKGGPTALSNWDKFKDVAQRLWNEEHGQAEIPATGKTGNVGGAAAGRKLAPINEEPRQDMNPNRRENGDLEFNHPNGTSQMILHPEADPRSGFEGKTQLRQTGISAVDAAGAGQEMMDNAVARIKGNDSFSRIVSDHPDLRSSENEGHWSKLARRGHNVQVEDAPNSYGEHEGGKSYFIDNRSPEASQIEAHEANGGSTFDAKGNNLTGTNKYSVAAFPERTVQIKGDLTPEALKSFKQKNADLLKEGYAVGTWKDPDTGNTVLDVAKLYDSKKTAVAAGKAANQKAIYHLGGEGEIPTGGTGTLPVNKVADNYNATLGRPEVKDVKTPINPKLADSIADAYDQLKHQPNNPKVKAAYKALIQETRAQWQALEDQGYRLEVKSEDPYGLDSTKPAYQEMSDDVKNNHRIQVWDGGKPPVDHPLSGIDPKTGVTHNTLFRAVHDIMGHVAGDNDFSQQGEENAYQRHAQSYSKDAIPALTTETRGQTSHYFNNARVRNGGIPDFVDQRAALLPEKFYAKPTTSGVTPESLKAKYGTTSDVLKAGFILPEGDMIPLTGEHDHMLGGKTTDDTREQFIRDTGTIRSRYRMTRAGEEQVFSLPSEITEDQARQIRAAAGKLRNGRIVLETVDGKSHQSLDFPTGAKAQSALEGLVKIKSDETPSPDASEIATRRPTSTRVTPTNAGGQYANMAGVKEASRLSPSANGKIGYAEKLARTVSKYTGLDFTDEELQNPEAVMEKFINRMTDNLVSLHDAMPEPMRRIARQWYRTANTLAKTMAEKHGVTPEQSAGVLASLSPQNGWDNNVALADRVLDTYKNRQNFEYSPKMEAQVAKIKQGQLSRSALGILKDIHGKTLAEVANDPMPQKFQKKWGAEADAKWKNVVAAKQAMWVRLYDESHNSPQNPMFHPNGDVVGMSPSNRSWIGLDHIAKSIRIINDGDVNSINNVMGYGNKIRNFYNNIINPDSPNGHTTIDTHAVGAAHFQPFSGDDAEVVHNFGSTPKGIAGAPKNASTGMRGTYPLYAEAYKRAASKLGLQPRELQSITWEGIRSLMGDEKKTPELKSFARETWEKVQNKELTPQHARDLIIEKAGGFSKPSWMSEADWDAAMGTGFNPEEFSHE